MCHGACGTWFASPADMRAPDRSLGVLDAIAARRAIRSYSPEPVDAATVNALLHAAVRAPTAMHAEPWSFVVVQDRARLARISDRAKALALAMPGIGAYYGALLRDPGFSVFYDASTLVVICATAITPFATADCWLAAENLMLAACAYGLGTCVIGFAVAALAASDVRAELGIPDDVTVVAPIVVGIPTSTPPPTSRRDPDILAWR